MRRLCIALTLLFLWEGATARTGSAAQASPTWREWQRAAEPKSSFRISQIIEGAGGKSEMVVLDGGASDGLLNGNILATYRISASTTSAQLETTSTALWVETGRLKLIEVQEQQSVAEILQDGSARSARFFPRFPGMMAGDLAVEQRVTISRRQINTPTASVRYDALFEDPKRNPSTFELKKEGLLELRRVAASFASARLSLLMIEGYTDQEGKAEANQVESYQRAMTVRQFLIDELGFDERRVVAVGYGEAEPADRSMAPGHKQINRRIVLKAIAAGPTKR